MLWSAASAASAEADLKAWKGKETPPLAREDLDGRKVDLKAMRGRVVLLNYWATWCDPCKVELPALLRLKDRFAGRPFELVTVNYGEFPEKIRGYLERENLALPVLLDTQKETAKPWGVGGIPMTFLVDAKGRVRYWAFGERDWESPHSVKTIERLLAEAPRARR
jgi:thiol-disulfide isomerase/thioredoxin